MPVLRRNQFDKQPSEKFPIDVNFAGGLPNGATKLVSATVSAIKWPRREPENTSDATSEVLFSTNAVIVGVIETKARFLVQDGQDGFEYKFTILGIFDNGSILEEEIFMRVREE